SMEIWGEPKAKRLGARMLLDAGKVEEAANELKAANAAYADASKKFRQYTNQLQDAAFKAQVGVAVVAVAVIAVAAVAVAAAPAAAAAGGADAAAGAAGADAAAAASTTAAADATATTATTTVPGALSPTLPAPT